jgi:hypothetical protein
MGAKMHSYTDALMHGSMNSGVLAYTEYMDAWYALVHKSCVEVARIYRCMNGIF